MKKLIVLSALAFGAVTSFAQSQNLDKAKHAAPVTNLTANAVSTPVSSAPVQNQAAATHDVRRANEIQAAGQKKNVKATEPAKAANTTNAARKSAVAPTK